MRYHVRCRSCETRRVLTRHPEDYVRLPACRACGQRSYRVDRWMMTRDNHALSCRCGGYWFQHRQGSLYCHYRRDGTARYPGDPDFHGER